MSSKNILNLCPTCGLFAECECDCEQSRIDGEHCECLLLLVEEELESAANDYCSTRDKRDRAAMRALEDLRDDIRDGNDLTSEQCALIATFAHKINAADLAGIESVVPYLETLKFSQLLGSHGAPIGAWTLQATTGDVLIGVYCYGSEQHEGCKARHCQNMLFSGYCVLLSSSTNRCTIVHLY